MELISSTHTSFACGLTLIADAIGVVLITIFAYISRDWLLLKWIISIYFAVSLPYLYFVPESPYWLLSLKKYNELKVCLRKMTKTNGCSADKWLPLYNQLVDDTRLTETTKKKENQKDEDIYDIYRDFTSICVLIIPFIIESHPLATTIVSQLGKLSVSSTVSVSWIYVPELFPTSMRGLANAVFVFVGSFGSILAPIVNEALGDKYVRISFYVYSGLIIILALIICTLPET